MKPNKLYKRSLILAMALGLVLTLAASIAIAQLTPGTPPVEWTRQFGNSPAYGVAVDASAVYVAGCFLTKLNKDGSEAWYIGPLCGSTPVNLTWRSVTTDGTALFVAGSGSFPAGGYNTQKGVIYKYDASTPTLLWSDRFTSSSSYPRVDGNALAADETGVYIGGAVAGTLPGQQNSGGLDAFVRKYALDSQSMAGVPLWTWQFGSVNNDFIAGVAVDVTGVYVVGQAQGPFGEVQDETINAFVRKYDKGGNELWTHAFADASAQAVAVDATGVYVAGDICTDAGCWDAFVRKYDTDGNELWTRQIGTSEHDYGRAVAVDGTGVYVAGATMGAFPGYTHAGGTYGYDAFACKYDTEGNLIWTYQFETSDDDWAYGIAADGDAAYVAVVTGIWPAGSSGLLVKLNNAQMVPTLTLPENQTMEATGTSGGAVVSFTATATDLQGTSLPVTCAPASGSTFPLGTTTVHCSATDVHNNLGQGSFTVTVVDTTPPKFTVLSANISTTATVAGGAYVTYSPYATDLVDGSVSVSCNPASGSLFGPGMSNVTCSATDQHGNTATESFTVTVTFSWSGFLQPINPDGTSIFKLGSSVPVKFQLTGTSAGIGNLAAHIYVAQVSNNAVGTYVEAMSTANADTGNSFRYDPTVGQYIFNWGTKSITSRGTYQIMANFGDGVPHTVIVSLK